MYIRDNVRIEVVKAMNNNKELSTFKGIKRNNIEDALCKLIVEIAGIPEQEYETRRPPKTELDEALFSLKPTKFEEEIYNKVNMYNKLKELNNLVSAIQELGFNENIVTTIKNNAKHITNKCDEEVKLEYVKQLQNLVKEYLC